jgi:hypothetical protein
MSDPTPRQARLSPPDVTAKPVRQGRAWDNDDPSDCPTPGLCACPDMPHCPVCAYTAHDAAYLMDHRFCSEPTPPNPRASLSHPRSAGGE